MNVGFLDVVYQSDYLTNLIGLLLLIILYIFYRKKDNKENFKPSTNYEFCNNPSCLRCNSKQLKHFEILKYEKIKRTLDIADLKVLVRLDQWVLCNDEDLVDSKQRPSVFYLPNVKSTPSIDPKYHQTDVNLLEDNYSLICDEFMQISSEKQVNNGWRTNETPTGSWQTFYLFNQGMEVQSNTARCPVTLSILQNLNGFLKNCQFGNACFSVIQPGTVISEHYGPCNVRSRCHLGLVTPSNYSLIIDGSSYKWTKGKCLLFDDSYLHSVQSEEQCLLHNSHLDRVVFMLDLWHYQINETEKKIIEGIFST